ncbi:MAG: metallophosphoesterase [Mycobacteriaceae bacterium]
MRDLLDALAATDPAEPVHRDRPNHPKGWEPGYEWNGTAGYVTTGPLSDRPKTWDDFIRDAGLDPAEVEVIEPVQVRGWDTSKREIDPETGKSVTSIVRAHYYRLNLRRLTLKLDLDELVKAAKRRGNQRNRPDADNTDSAYLVALGDLQLGKMDGDGVEGTVQRFLDKTTAAVARYKRVAKGSPIYLVHLGDCIEGFVSQGGANTFRTTLTTTEQVRLYRRLLIEQVKAFSAITDRLVVVGVPGNHDEALRPLHTYGDSWAIDAIAAVRDALDLAGTYEHVTMIAPARDELTVTLDMAGTVVGMAHGHQWRPGQHVNWWSKQAHGRQPVGDAHLLLCGHLHHLRIEQTGSDKTFIQVPALESGSQWWKHRTGEWGQPGIVTAVVGGGSWHSLEVL